VGQIIANSSWGRHEESAVGGMCACYCSGCLGVEGMRVLQGGTELWLTRQECPGAASLEPGELGSSLLGIACAGRREIQSLFLALPLM